VRKRLIIGLFLLIPFMLPTIHVLQPVKLYAMNIEIRIKDLPQHGLSLISVTDPSFEMQLSAALPKNIPDNSLDAFKYLSVFLKNSAQRPLVAYQLKWEMVSTNGRVSSYYRTFADPLLLMENSNSNEQSAKRASGQTILPNSMRILSVVPISSESGLGGLAISSTGREEAESIKRAAQQRELAEVLSIYISKLKDIISVTVSIDGAFFDDGTFVGPDESDFFAQFKAHRDARYDLYKNVSAMYRSKELRSQLLSYLTKLTNEHISSPNPRSSPAEHYAFFKRLYADELLRILKTSGENGIVNFVEPSLSKPWISPRKL